MPDLGAVPASEPDSTHASGPSAPPDPSTWGRPDLAAPRPVPGLGLLDRLRGSVALRRFVPTPLALWGVGLVYQLAARALPGRLAYAEATARAVLPLDADEARVRRVALAHVASTARAWELIWRPEALRTMPLEGREHLEAAQASGRGVLVSYCHFGPELGWARMSGEMPLLVVLGEWVEEPTPPGFNGLQVEQRRKLLADAGLPTVNVVGAARTMLSVLSGGGAVLLAMDVPGPRVTRFLGRDVEMADGSARLAHRTGSLVLPGFFVPRGRGWALRFLPAIDSRDFGSWQELHQAVADLHSSVIERGPEHLASPLRPGFWGRVDESGWFRE